MSGRKKLYIILGIVLFLIAAECAGYFVWAKYFKNAKEAVPVAQDLKNINSSVDINNATQELKKELNLKMVFYAQAPFGNWDYPWQEACEEASILLTVNEYLDKNWTREQFNKEILDLVEYEKKQYGQYEHQTAAEITKILKDRYALDSVIINNPSFEYVRQTLNKGHLIIMTFAGKKIGNPYYKNGGPIYHAMVIKGYKEGQKIITADVGTKNGEDYVYSWQTIIGALHDWATPIENGPKRMIEVMPPDVKTSP
jgi:hypothetical protein